MRRMKKARPHDSLPKVKIGHVEFALESGL